jgi:hypothetical protein
MGAAAGSLLAALEVEACERGGGVRGGGGRGGRGGGRRSDVALKHDIHLLSRLDFYRFSYNGSDRAYVSVIAQEVEAAACGGAARYQGDEVRRDDMAKAAAPYGQPEPRPNADH